MRKFVKRVNVVKPICNLLVGKDHKFAHRALVGLIIAVIGVIIAKTLGHSHEQVIAIAGDTVGYGLHAAGLTPYIEELLAAGE